MLDSLKGTVEGLNEQSDPHYKHTQKKTTYRSTFSRWWYGEVRTKQQVLQQEMMALVIQSLLVMSFPQTFWVSIQVEAEDP